MPLSVCVIYVTLTSCASCIFVSFSSSAENDVAVSFLFRAENKLPFSALVSFSAENAKPGFGRSLATVIGLSYHIFYASDIRFS